MTHLQARHRFSVENYLAMARTAILGENEKLELVNGDIVEMTPVGSRHAGCINYLNRQFVGGAGSRAVVSIQNPVEIDEHSMPEPDIALLRPREDSYRNSHPVATDILLLVEVSDSSLEYDRGVKLPLYARSGVREVWIVNLADNSLEVHRGPSEGAYTITRTIRKDPNDEASLSEASLAPQALPDVVVDVKMVLG